MQVKLPHIVTFCLNRTFVGCIQQLLTQAAISDNNEKACKGKTTTRRVILRACLFISCMLGVAVAVYICKQFTCIHRTMCSCVISVICKPISSSISHFVHMRASTVSHRLSKQRNHSRAISTYTNRST
jgi:hypothetical protein